MKNAIVSLALAVCVSIPSLSTASEFDNLIPKSVFADAPFSRVDIGTSTYGRVAAADEAAGQNGLRPLRRVGQERDLVIGAQELAPLPLRLGAVQPDHEDRLVQTRRGADLAEAVGRGQGPLRQEEKHGLTVAQMAGDVGRPVAAGGDALVVP